LDIEVRIEDVSKTRTDTILLGIFDGVKKLSGNLVKIDKSLKFVSRLLMLAAHCAKKEPNKLRQRQSVLVLTE
jgi:hypothetical protein